MLRMTSLTRRALQADYAFIAPSHIVQLIKSDLTSKYDTSSIRDVITGGACVADAAVNGLCKLFNLKTVRQGECVVHRLPHLIATM